MREEAGPGKPRKDEHLPVPVPEGSGGLLSLLADLGEFIPGIRTARSLFRLAEKKISKEYRDEIAALKAERRNHLRIMDQQRRLIDLQIEEVEQLKALIANKDKEIEALKKPPQSF